MDFHIDRKLRFGSEPKHKSLYSWFIAELDQQGQQTGQDQIPWGWRLAFTATELVLSDTLSLTTEGLIADRLPRRAENSKRRVIRAKLRPGDPRRKELFARQTTYKMFGADRPITDFRLDIVPIDDPKEQENCSAWGSVSYTAETDFRHETSSDIVNFYLMVRPETFDLYAARIADGTADEVILSVGGVEGFYSEWSPSVSTRDVKVLTRGDEHNVEMPEGVIYEVPRLGPVGEAELFINAVRTQPDRPVDEDDGEPQASAMVRPEQAPASFPGGDPETIRLLSSIKSAAWVIAVATGLMLIFTVF